ncbi:MAG TPA: M14 family zinc carboxypeptidase, partial [Longimicrobiales bacterium]|nr:M14 family zinc carboxypeptidase [Longimicrobiales bacterium]
MRSAPFAAATAAVLACGGPSPGGPPVPGGRTPPRPDLARLHEEVRVPGLEDRRFGPDAYWRVLGPVVRRGGLSMEEVGRSAEGRPLRLVSFGQGPVTVLMWSQMHGNESTASMALVDVLELVGERPDDPLVRTITRGVTVHLLPMLNPDGALRFQRRNAQGVDINRDARLLATPEARTLKAVRDRLDPDFGFNLHDQNAGTRVGSSDRGVAIALLAPAFDASGEVDDLRRRAMEVIGVVVGAITPLVEDRIARYDDTFNPRAFGDLMAAWGSSTILIESGGLEGDPQKQRLRRANFVALLAALESIATESWKGVGTGVYDALPRNGRRVADLLIAGGTLAVPGLPPNRADLLIDYARPLLEEGGTISDIGDLEGTEAQDTVRVDGLY